MDTHYNKHIFVHKTHKKLLLRSPQRFFMYVSLIFVSTTKELAERERDVAAKSGQSYYSSSMQNKWEK